MVMKTKYLLSIIAVAAAVVACNNEKPLIEVTDAGDVVTLTASIGTPVTKIHFNGDKDTYTETRWEDGDCIWVRSDTQAAWERGDCFKTSASQISGDGHSAEFTGRTRVEGRICAVYPFDMVLPGSDNDAVVLAIPESNILVPGDCPANSNAAVAFWADGSTSFSMEYLLGALKVSVTGNGQQIVKASITDTGKMSLWGTMKVIPDYQDKEVAWTELENSSINRNKATLTTKPIALSASPLEFYFLLPEGALTDGFVLRLTDTEDNTYLFVSDKNNQIVAGKVVRMPVVDLENALSESDIKLFSGGEGIAMEPYQIATPDDLVQLAAFLADDGKYASFAGKYYVQTADIDMDGKEFVPIGLTSAKPFTGNYDGKGYKISNLAAGGASSDNPASGVFGYADGAVITGIVVENRSNTGTFNRVGGVIGYAKNCTVSKCVYSGGELTATTNMCAGIIGHQAGGSISGCQMTGGKITSTGPYAAGIVAYCTAGAVVNNCTVRGGVTISGTYGIGGVVGRIDRGSISNCAFIGGSKVVASSNYAAGICATSIGDGECVIDGCFVLENCSVTATYCAAGILGYVYPNDNQSITVANCGIQGGVIRSTSCDTGADPAKGDCMSGGIVGWLRTSHAGNIGKILNCYCHVSAGGFPCDLNMSHPSIGGIVGYVSTKNNSGNEILIANCASSTVQSDITIAGNAISDTSDSAQVGTIVGWGTGSSTVTVDHCHYLNSTGLAIGAGEFNKTDNLGYDVATFTDGSTVIEALNGFASAYSGLSMHSWTIDDNNLPVLDE